MRPLLTVSHAYLSFSYSCAKDTRQELEEPDISRIRFSNNHISKYILLLRKGVYPYEYKFNQTLPEKEKKISKIRKILLMQITCMQKEFVETLKYKI